MEGLNREEQNTEEENTLLQRLLSDGLTERLYSDIFYARREDLCWDIFYHLIDLQSEKDNGFWLSARVATTLLAPIISMQFYKNQNARVNERVEDDFSSEVLMTIADMIPKYDKTKAQFPHYINLYICQCGYVHNKDSSVYMQRKKGIRIFSQDSISEKMNDGQGQKDSYSNIAGSTSIEDEVERREIMRKNAVFSNVVIKKTFSCEKDRIDHHNAEKLAELKDEARLLKMSADENVAANSERIRDIENYLDEDSNKKLLREDWNKTITNATIWAKFLGGVESYDGLFFEKIVEEIERKETERTETEREQEENEREEDMI